MYGYVIVFILLSADYAEEDADYAEFSIRVNPWTNDVWIK